MMKEKTILYKILIILSKQIEIDVKPRISYNLLKEILSINQNIELYIYQSCYLYALPAYLFLIYI